MKKLIPFILLACSSQTDEQAKIIQQQNEKIAELTKQTAPKKFHTTFSLTLNDQKYDYETNVPDFQPVGPWKCTTAHTTLESLPDLNGKFDRHVIQAAVNCESNSHEIDLIVWCDPSEEDKDQVQINLNQYNKHVGYVNLSCETKLVK